MCGEKPWGNTHDPWLWRVYISGFFVINTDLPNGNGNVFSNELLNCFERLWAKYVCENRLWRYFYSVDVASLLLYREYTRLDDKDILFLNAQPVENVLHPVCTESVHIVLRNDHSSLNDLVMTLEIRYVSIQELQLDLRCYTRSSWKYSQFAVSKCISTKISAETHFEHVAALDLIMSGESQIIRVCDRCLSRSGEKSLKDLLILTSRLWHYSYSVDVACFCNALKMWKTAQSLKNHERKIGKPHSHWRMTRGKHMLWSVLIASVCLVTWAHRELMWTFCKID